MAPRHPPDKPDDEPSKLQQVSENAPDTVTPANEHRVPKTERDAPRPAQAEDEDVELDRIEAYLRGPTAFTA
jgi:hypothetical protein